MSQDKKEKEEKVNKEEQVAEEQTAKNESAENAAAETEQESAEESKDSKKQEKQKKETTEDKLQELGTKLAEMNDKYVRSVADFDNYRKRTNQEKLDLVVNGGKDTIKAILPIVDDLERALSSMADDDPAKEGIQIIFNKFMNILTQKGLRYMEVKGQKFDSNLHEAVAQVPAPDESQKGMVIDETQKGYYLNDKVLRFAKVVVAI